ncbi:hypothetical protein [Pediococcus argentinicus]|nr:hypothetical protein [Pediococcus argentinicus]NKZ22663.1 hypothetical protein [Pediococcus argentinicus]GEP19697.1 hypothetical protein LSA03_10810 [Pediococcus argentinicus]
MRRTKNALLDYLLKNLENSELVDRLLDRLQSQGQLALRPIPIENNKNRK